MQLKDDKMCTKRKVTCDKIITFSTEDNSSLVYNIDKTVTEIIITADFYIKNIPSANHRNACLLFFHNLVQQYEHLKTDSGL